jgi:hypothetical protein
VQILHPFVGSIQQYSEELSDPDRYRPDHCPQCAAHRPLTAHGFYTRTLMDIAFRRHDPSSAIPVPLLQTHGVAAARVRLESRARDSRRNDQDPKM